MNSQDKSARAKRNPTMTGEERLASLNRTSDWLEETAPERKDYTSLAAFRDDLDLWELAYLRIDSRLLDASSEIRAERRAAGWTAMQVWGFEPPPG